MKDEQFQARLGELERKWLAGTITPGEEKEYMHWYNQEDNKPVSVPADLGTDITEHRERLYTAIQAQVTEQKSRLRAHRVHFLKTSWFRYAAAVIIVLGGAAVFKLTTDHQRLTTDDRQLLSVNADIAPGTNRAVLRIDNNKPIDLASNKTGVTVNNSIKYTDGSTIGNLSVVAGQSSMVTLSTPRGGQYQIVLPDGSKAWLNAASSIKFPTAFTGSSREVEMSGEVYIEVAKNTKQPFLVHTSLPPTPFRRGNGGGWQTVKVLGTSFNINAYTNEEAIRTTLVEGSVKVSGEWSVVSDKTDISHQPSDVILKPGQQVEFTHYSPLTTHNIDVDKVLAWKNGLFNFNGADLPTVMRQLERWYDVTVTYEGNIPQGNFQGKMDRGLTLSQVLKILAESEVNCRLEGRKLVVTSPL